MSVPGPQRRRRLLPAAFAAAALLLAGCGDGGDGGGEEEGEPVTFVQAARSGSFLGEGAGSELVLRGVGGATAVSPAGDGDGSAGAIATAKLFRFAPRLLGEAPWRATLSGAEVGRQSYELLLAEPRFDGVLGAVRYRVEGTEGLPERPPASFGAATLTVFSSLDGASLSGRVSSAEDGAPLAGALVSAGAEGPGLVAVRADEEGRFRLGPLPPGSYELEASSPGFETAGERVAIPAGEGAALALEPTPAGD